MHFGSNWHQGPRTKFSFAPVLAHSFPTPLPLKLFDFASMVLEKMGKLSERRIMQDKGA